MELLAIIMFSFLGLFVSSVVIQSNLAVVVAATNRKNYLDFCENVDSELKAIHRQMYVDEIVAESDIYAAVDCLGLRLR